MKNPVPLSILEKEQDLKNQRIDLEACPVGSVRPEIRRLPLPFKSFFSVNSDCDAPNMEAYECVGHVVREACGLPISDSYFPKWLTKRAVLKGSETDAFQQEDSLHAFIEANYSFIRFFHQGWFDTVHGWFHRFLIKVADDFNLKPAVINASSHKEDDSACLNGEKAELIDNDKHQLLFRLPPLPWQQVEPPHYLVFDYRLPFTGSTFDILFSYNNERIKSIHCDHSYGSMDFRRLIIDLWPVLGQAKNILHGFIVEFKFNGPDYGIFEVKQPSLYSDVRRDMMHQAGMLKKMNIFSSVYSSHGGGYNLGLRSVPSMLCDDPRGIAENSDNPYFTLDLLKENGLEFMNTATNTTTMEMLKIEQIVFMAELNNTDVVYDYNRSFYIPVDEHGKYDYSPFCIDGQSANLTCSDFSGFMIDNLIKKLTYDFDGALLYTHLLSVDPLNRQRIKFTKDLFPNTETRNAFQSLSDKFYNLSGSIPDRERVFIAPTSVLLRMSQMLNELPYHCWYDVDRNEVHINSWFDPVIKRQLPDKERFFRELRYLPFPVKDAKSAKLFVDKVEITHLFRKEAQDGNWISVVDISTPLNVVKFNAPGIVLNKVSLSQNKHPDQKDEQNSYQFRLRSGTGDILIPADHAVLMNRQTLGLKLSKTDSSIKVQIEIVTDDGLEIILREKDFIGETKGYTCQLSGKMTSYFFPFFELIDSLPVEKRKIPVGRVRHIRMLLTGTLGEGVDLKFVRFYRDNENPISSDGYILGGQVYRAEDEITGIFMEYDDLRYKAVLMPSGSYYFIKKVKYGSRVRIWAEVNGQLEIFPITGEYHEVLCDCTEVDFIKQRFI